MSGPKSSSSSCTQFDEWSSNQDVNGLAMGSGATNSDLCRFMSINDLGTDSSD